MLSGAGDGVKEGIMSLSNCEKCWETPCVCGWQYRNYTLTARLKLAANILGISAEKLLYLTREVLPEAHPDKQETQ